jgi:hypothetical protein
VARCKARWLEMPLDAGDNRADARLPEPNSGTPWSVILNYPVESAT